ncbi:hypothetical protein ACLB2K_045579 [Fragaria x ananassa]
MPSSQSRSRWSPPTQGIKLNVDGAYLPNESEGGVEGILRNTQGHALAAFANHVSFVNSAKHIELLAIKAALEWLSQQGYKEGHIETDCKVVVLDLRVANFSDMEYANLIDDIHRIQQMG